MLSCEWCCSDPVGHKCPVCGALLCAECIDAEHGGECGAVLSPDPPDLYLAPFAADGETYSPISVATGKPCDGARAWRAWRETWNGIGAPGLWDDGRARRWRQLRLFGKRAA